jgi:hypothetical protein
MVDGFDMVSPVLLGLGFMSWCASRLREQDGRSKDVTHALHGPDQEGYF